MTNSTKDRYKLDSLPISDTTKKGLSKDNIDQIGTIGRMLSLQDEFLEDLLGGIQKTVEKIEKRLDAIELRLDKIEQNLEDKEGRIKAIEKHISPYGTFLRVGFGVVIGIIISIVSFILIHPYLKP
jgi:tetrahydromethanopterin S-methyltransferase subunit G